jgi:hypothetical protein
MVGRTLKQAITAATLSGVMVGLMGCTSLMPKAEPTPVAAEPQQKAVSTTPQTKVVKRKKVTAKNAVKPVGETTPVVVPPYGGGGGGNGGGGGGGG